MAKKKASLQKAENTVKAVTPSMESEGSEKIDQLKSLNQMLLKETVERRQQVQSLVHEKDSLETELTRSKSERDELKSELTRLGDRVARMELEGNVVTDFVAVQVGLKGEDVWRRIKGLELENEGLKSEIGEKENEIRRLSEKLGKVEGLLRNEREVLERVSMESDGLKSELDAKSKEIRRLKEALNELEEGKGEMVRKLQELRDVCDRVVGEKEDSEMRVESITREKDSLARGLEGANKLKQELTEKLRRVARLKEMVEKDKNEEILKRVELENIVNGLNEMVTGLQKEEKKLRGIVVELEKHSYEGEERQKDLTREIDQLVGEKKLSEKKVEGLLVEKTVMEKELGEAIEKLNEQNVKIEELVNENIAFKEAKTQLDGEIGGLRSQIAELMGIISKLEECNQSEVGRLKSLECELGEYRCKLEVFKTERDEMKNCVQEEKENSEALKRVVEELENQVEESIKAAEKAKAENAAILAVKTELESEHKILSQKIASLESTITEARTEYDSMKGKAELADTKSERVLSMLKDTASFCSKNENDGENSDLDADHKLVDDEEAMVFVAELETIKNAYKSKVSKVENMRRELEFLQNSVAEAQKKKGFWTMLSSATTVLAAVSIAYIARGH